MKHKDSWEEWKKKQQVDSSIPYHKRETGEVVKRLHRELFPHIKHKDLAKAMLHATKAFKDRYNKNEVNSTHNYEAFTYQVNNPNKCNLLDTHIREKDGKEMRLCVLDYKYGNGEVYYAIVVDGVIVTFITEDMKFYFKDSETVGNKLYNSKQYSRTRWYKRWRKDYVSRKQAST